MFHLNASFKSFNIILLPNAEPKSKQQWTLSLKYSAESANYGGFTTGGSSTVWDKSLSQSQYSNRKGKAIKPAQSATFLLYDFPMSPFNLKAVHLSLPYRIWGGTKWKFKSWDRISPSKIQRFFLSQWTDFLKFLSSFYLVHHKAAHFCTSISFPFQWIFACTADKAHTVTLSSLLMFSSTEGHSGHSSQRASLTHFHFSFQDCLNPCYKWCCYWVHGFAKIHEAKNSYILIKCNWQSTSDSSEDFPPHTFPRLGPWPISFTPLELKLLYIALVS